MKGVPEDLLATLHPLEHKVIPHLKEGITLSELVTKTGMQEVEVMRALQWLENKKCVGMDHVSAHEVHIDANGLKAIEHGMPEHRFLNAVKAGARTNDEVMQKAGLNIQEFGVSVGLLKKQGLVDVKENIITATGKDHAEDAITFLKKLQKGPAPLPKLSKKEQETLAALKSRREYVIVKERKDRIVHLTELGKELVKVDIKSLDFAERLTAEDLKTGAWKGKRYRSFDVTAPVRPSHYGKEHFVNQAIDYIRSIWLEMGFVEMEGDIVQSAFWNLDALFVPQDHPAREMQDTFYLDHPARTTINRSAFDRVRDAHENGAGTGSKGWRYSFSRMESEQLLLRTQGTALSAHTLWRIREGKLPMPGKYFLVGKVFRNEALDWKHLFEFHHVEGIVVDPNVNFAQLISYIRTFLAKLGFHKIRLRPSYFPFTEPSVEVDVWNEGKQQWVEVVGAGVFRPEVTKALLGEEVPVLAWGMGMERIIVEYFNLNDLRDLYKNDIKQLREMPRFVKM